MILHEKIRLPFERSLELARKRGYLKPERKLKLALDTTAVLGQGAVKDTYNLLADGIRKLIWELAQQGRQKPQRWAEKRGLGRYFGSSIKGEAELDWSDQAQRDEFLGSLVADAEQLLELAREARGHLQEGGRAERRLLAASQLLSQLLLQDVERKPEGGVQIRQGTSAERIPSVHDPEIRHGRKSKHVRFDGHKLAVAVDTEEQLITAVDVLEGSAQDDQDAMKLVEESVAATGTGVDVVIADTAYGSGQTRREFADAGVRLVARTPHLPERGYFSKARFEIDFERGTCKCPSGHTTRERNSNGFWFPAQTCNACPLRSHCYSARSGRGREVPVHPEEQLLAQARALQRSRAWRPLWRRRQVVEHRIAGLAQLGIRQARYRGRQRTLFQALLTAAVANLTLVGGGSSARSCSSAPLRRLRQAARRLLSTVSRFVPMQPAVRRSVPSPSQRGLWTSAFRPDF